MQLKDKVMIVTGATSGIGEAIAKAAAAADARRVQGNYSLGQWARIAFQS
jgi:NAD(P)-dependent dehydrogenase (short-subunit alcohol dehydrogenase family)